MLERAFPNKKGGAYFGLAPIHNGSIISYRLLHPFSLSLTFPRPSSRPSFLPPLTSPLPSLSHFPVIFLIPADSIR